MCISTFTYNWQIWMHVYINISTKSIQIVPCYSSKNIVQSKNVSNLHAPSYNVHSDWGLHQILIKKKYLKNIKYKVGVEIFCHFLCVHNVFSTMVNQRNHHSNTKAIFLDISRSSFMILPWKKKNQVHRMRMHTTCSINKCTVFKESRII